MLIYKATINNKSYIGKTIFSFNVRISQHKCQCVLFADHDLGTTPDCHYERNGYQLIMDLFKDGIYPVMVRVITANPVGRKNIEAALMAEGYSVNGIGEWSR